MASISFASESLMDARIQVKLDKYQKCGNIISQTSLLSSYTGSETDADSDSRFLHYYTEGYSESTEPIDAVNILPLARFEPTTSARFEPTTFPVE